MLAHATPRRYAQGAAANSAADLGRSEPEWRTSAAVMPGAFFVPAMRNGGCAWDAFERAGFHSGRSANPRTVAPIRCLAAAGDDSSPNGVRPMFPTRNPSARAAAHRAMARAALFADSSASTRLKRYNTHMSKARRLEAATRGQEVAS